MTGTIHIRIANGYDYDVSTGLENMQLSGESISAKEQGLRPAVVAQALPQGWEQRTTPDGRLFYIGKLS